MSISIKTIPFFLCVLALQLVFLQGNTQVKYHSNDDLSIIVAGTSTMHDWDMKTSQGEVNATITVNANGQLSGLTTLNFSAPATSLKSDHSSMDKNAYKALNTDKNTNISFTLTSATVAADGSIKCLGKLSIAGTTIDSWITATSQVNADKSISIKGSKKISMKEFNMKPPSFMMGTVKTGNDVTVSFTLKLKK